MNDQTIGFKVSLKEKEELKTLAKERNLKLSDYLRQELLLRNNWHQEIPQALALLLLYNGSTFTQEAINEIDFILNIFDRATSQLNRKQFNLLNQVKSALITAKGEIEEKGEHLFVLDNGICHEFWVTFLNPDLTKKRQ